MKPFLTELFEYNLAINQKMIDCMQMHQVVLPEKTKVLMSHILRAHEIWNTRIHKAPQIAGPWEPFPMSDYSRINAEQHRITQAILQEKDLEEIISYTTIKGESFENKTRDILFHVVNHSNYHRGQINTELKAVGIQTVITDYIFYKRS